MGSGREERVVSSPLHDFLKLLPIPLGFLAVTTIKMPIKWTFKANFFTKDPRQKPEDSVAFIPEDQSHLLHKVMVS